jgi:hypothetical protein
VCSWCGSISSSAAIIAATRVGHPPDSPKARALLAEQGLGPADLDRALAHLERTEGTTVRAIVGINEDGVFGTSGEACRPDLPDACHDPFIPLLWLKVHELLGRVPEGSTARFVEDGTLPGEAHGAATDYRIAS